MRFGLTPRFFANKDILELGPGPYGLVYEMFEAKSRIGIEPMNMLNLMEEWKRKFVVRSVGEAIPVMDKSFDAVICFNTLDHCEMPSRVINESWRVLRNGGTLLLWVYTLRNSFGFLQSFLDRLDALHPYHFTKNQISELVQKWFIIQWERKSRGTAFDWQLTGKHAVKMSLASYVAESLTMRLDAKQT
jgi:SAM-dependent methyltransferase